MAWHDPWTEHADRTLSPREFPHARCRKTRGMPLEGEVAELKAEVDALQTEVHELTKAFAVTECERIDDHEKLKERSTSCMMITNR